MPANMDGQQIVQSLIVQAGDMAGTFEHGVRRLMTRAKADEVVPLRLSCSIRTETNQYVDGYANHFLDSNKSERGARERERERERI